MKTGSLKKVSLGLVAVVLSVSTFLVIRHFYWRSHPQSAFEAVLGVEFPPGLSITAYGSCINDNFFHTTHFWRIQGDGAALRDLSTRFGYARSDEDALWALPTSKSCIDPLPSRDDVLEGYEWETPRNHWYYLMKGERDALLVY